MQATYKQCLQVQSGGLTPDVINGFEINQNQLLCGLSFAANAKVVPLYVIVDSFVGMHILHSLQQKVEASCVPC